MVRDRGANRSKLAQIANRLARENPEAAQIAGRFSHPAIRASVLGFLVLDTQLTFYAEATGQIGE